MAVAVVCGAGASMTRIRRPVPVWAGDSVSLTLTVTGKSPVTTGVPAMTRVSPSGVAVIPRGSPLTRPHLTPPFPPLADSEAE